MTTTLELLETLKASNGGASDLALSQILGVTHQNISLYRRGLSNLSDKLAILACENIGIDPAPYLLRLRVERAKCDSEKQAWSHILQRLGGVAA